MLLYIVLYQTVLLSESFEQLGGHDLLKIIQRKLYQHVDVKSRFKMSTNFNSTIGCMTLKEFKYLCKYFDLFVIFFADSLTLETLPMN